MKDLMELNISSMFNIYEQSKGDEHEDLDLANKLQG